MDISKIKGTYANGNTSYTYTTPNLMSGDSYTFAFVSKDTVRFVANNLVQTVGSIKPVTVTSAVGDIKIEYQLSGTAWVTTCLLYTSRLDEELSILNPLKRQCLSVRVR